MIHISTKKLLSLGCIVLTLLLLSGCFLLPEEAPLPPLPVPEQRGFATIYLADLGVVMAVRVMPPVFVTAPVTRGDIVLESFAIARYVPVRVKNHHFTEDNIPILGIFVSVGDEVSAGDVIAALDIPEIQGELEELNRRRTRLALELTLLGERQALISRLAADSGETVDNSAFATAANNLRTDLALLDRLIEHVAALDADRYLRAEFDGVVVSVAPFAEDMRSRAGMLIARISDVSYTAFRVLGTWAEGMAPGDRLEMALGNEMFLMEVVDPYEMGFYEYDRPEPEFATAYLSFLDAHPPAGFEDMTGSIHIPLDGAVDVLRIPVGALHQVAERTFVYVLDENGLRAIRDVVAGIENDYYVEIISGLAEGELVIL